MTDPKTIDELVSLKRKLRGLYWKLALQVGQLFIVALTVWYAVHDDYQRATFCAVIFLWGCTRGE
jgi:hypothetical protein